jgi:hypothetical protein
VGYAEYNSAPPLTPLQNPDEPIEQDEYGLQVLFEPESASLE